MRAFSILVTRVHFWSRDKGCGYIIRSAVRNPMLHENITALRLIERGFAVIADRSFTLGEYMNFRRF